MVTRNTPASVLCITAAAFAVTALLQARPASAAPETTNKIIINPVLDIEETPFFEARMSVSYLSGEAGEYVYVPEYNHKLSELKWEFEDVYMLNLGASISPASWLTINLDGWINMTEGDNTMDDYDWYYVNYDYTHWSHHDQTDMTTAFILDLSADMSFYQYQTSKFYGILGFKYDTYEWEAYGGDYVYSTYYLYDTVFSMSDSTKVITYEQNYYAPYIGIGFSSNLWETPLNFSGRFIFSPYVWGDDKDQHHLRSLVFEEDFDSGTMIAFDFAAKYFWTKNFTSWLSFHYQNYDEMKGETTVTDLTTGVKTEYTGDVAGMDSESTLISLGVSLSF